MEFVGTGPVAPAVSVEDFKRAVSIEQDVSDYDALIVSYLAAAEDVVATGANRPLSVGAYRFSLPLGAWSRWWFPCAPVVSLVSIEQRDSQGHWSPVPDGAFGEVLRQTQKGSITGHALARSKRLLPVQLLQDHESKCLGCMAALHHHLATFLRTVLFSVRHSARMSR